MNRQVVKVVPAPVPYIYDAKLIKLVDGDTVHLEVSRAFEFTVDFGFHQQEKILITRSAQETFRLARINAPEIGTQAGKDAKEALAVLLQPVAGAYKALTAKTLKQDKYGRWLLELYVQEEDKPDLNVNDWMVAEKYAVPYMESAVKSTDG